MQILSTFSLGWIGHKSLENKGRNIFAEPSSPEEFQKDQIRPKMLILVSVWSLFSRGPSFKRKRKLKMKNSTGEKLNVCFKLAHARKFRVKGETPP